MKEAWRDFEESVAAFLTALEPTATVTHNKILPDKDTGRPRQRDVWIEAKLGGHIPISVLVSCKRYKVRLNQQHVDAFIGELRSSGANKGVLYSYSGFTKAALEKAARNGISCCVLLDGSSLVIPDRVMFLWHCFAERVQLRLSGALEQFSTASEIFDLGSKQGSTFLAQVVAAHRENRETNLASHALWPSSWVTALRARSGDEFVQIDLVGMWRAFRAKKEAILLRGSYSFTDGNFRGSVASPVVDTYGPHPGPDWEEINAERTSAQAADFIVGSIILRDAPMERILRDQFGAAKPDQIGLSAEP